LLKKKAFAACRLLDLVSSPHPLKDGRGIRMLLYRRLFMVEGWCRINTPGSFSNIRVMVSRLQPVIAALVVLVLLRVLLVLFMNDDKLPQLCLVTLRLFSEMRIPDRCPIAMHVDRVHDRQSATHSHAEAYEQTYTY
jgi:hypothetical protein